MPPAFCAAAGPIDASASNRAIPARMAVGMRAIGPPGRAVSTGRFYACWYEADATDRLVLALILAMASARRQHQPVDRRRKTEILVEAPGVVVEGVHRDLDMAGTALPRPVDDGHQQLLPDAPAAPVGPDHEIVELDHLAPH